jgi:hypothetical protein
LFFSSVSFSNSILTIFNNSTQSFHISSISFDHISFDQFFVENKINSSDISFSFDFTSFLSDSFIFNNIHSNEAVLFIDPNNSISIHSIDLNDLIVPFSIDSFNISLSRSNLRANFNSIDFSYIFTIDKGSLSSVISIDNIEYIKSFNSTVNSYVSSLKNINVKLDYSNGIVSTSTSFNDIGFPNDIFIDSFYFDNVFDIENNSLYSTFNFTSSLNDNSFNSNGSFTSSFDSFITDLSFNANSSLLISNLQPISLITSGSNSSSITSINSTQFSGSVVSKKYNDFSLFLSSKSFNSTSLLSLSPFSYSSSFDIFSLSDFISLFPVKNKISGDLKLNISNNNFSFSSNEIISNSISASNISSNGIISKNSIGFDSLTFDFSDSDIPFSNKYVLSNPFSFDFIDFSSSSILFNDNLHLKVDSLTDISFVIDSFLYKDKTYGKFNFSSDLNLGLTDNLPFISGSVDLINSDISYLLDFSCETDADIISSYNLKKSTNGFFSNSIIEIDILNSNKLSIFNSSFSAVVDLDLHISKQKKSDIHISGPLDIFSGSYFFDDKKLKILPSHIVFTNSLPINPLIDLHLSYSIKDTIVFIDVSGSYELPILKFSSEPFLEKKDIISLLVTGSKLSSNDSFINKSASIFIGNLIANEINSAFDLDFDKLEFYQNQDSIDVQVGKQVSKNVILNYKNSNNSNSLLIEYSISDSLGTDIEVGSSNSIDFFFKKEY